MEARVSVEHLDRDRNPLSHQRIKMSNTNDDQPRGDYKLGIAPFGDTPYQPPTTWYGKLLFNAFIVVTIGWFPVFLIFCIIDKLNN